MANAKAVFIQDDQSYYDAGQFNALSGTDGNTIESNLAGDPLFADPSTGNYLPQDQSPAVDGGIPVGLSADYELGPRLVGAAPDIGPLETEVVPLPISWGCLRLEVREEEKMAVLHWETLTEQNSDYFSIERRGEGGQWREIGRREAMGNSYQPVQYRFIDTAPPMGTLYYRLKQVDWDGSYSYSSILSDKLEGRGQLRLARVQTDELLLLSDSGRDWSGARLRIVDYAGRQWRELMGSPEVPLEGLPAGAYLLLLYEEGKTEAFPFVR